MVSIKDTMNSNIEYCIYSLTIIIIALLYPARSTIQTLAECDKEGKIFCYTGESSHNRHQEMDAAIERNAKMHEIFTNELRREYEEYVVHRRRRRAVDEKKKGPTTDCSGVCCSVVEDSPPYSHFKTHNGWQDIASTPKYPQRVSFTEEKCLNQRSPCRGVKSVDGDMRPQCIQVERMHKIFLYNSSNANIQTRYVSVPAGCKCQLERRSPRA